MGLAASQARFLGLTARKSNVEYQGQQINQARTALSNEVMDLYQEYNRLKVPVPPSVNDYTKTTYTIDSTYENYKMTNFSKITSGQYEGYYNVTLSYDDEVAKAYSYVAKSAIVTADMEGNPPAFKEIKGITIGADSYYYDPEDPGSTISKIIVTEETDIDKYPGLATVMKDLGMETGTFYSITRDGVAYYTTEDDLKSTAYNQEGVYNGDYLFHYQGQKKETKNIPAIAALSQASTGRWSEIAFIKCDDDKGLVGHSYSITTGSEDDQKAYEEAMNQYYYKKQIYEREVEIINKKTEKIQAEDKALELKLNQLDTEQNAISTEMDSISKVIEDTIDSVFKTFNS